MRRLGPVVLMVLLLASLLTACGAASPKANEATSVEDGSRGSTGAAPWKGSEQKSSAPPNATAPAPAGSPADTAYTPNQAPPASAPIPDTSNRKIILNAQYELKVENADDAIAQIGMAVRASGGYVQETQQSGTKPQGRVVHMTLRVPAGQYGPITEMIRETGEILTQREWTEDVTDQFVDLEARVRSQEIHLKQLEALYDRGGSIREMMELENEIARVTSDIESMKGRLRVLADRVDFSTIMLTLHEPQAPMPVQPPKTVLERMQRGFVGSWNGVVNFLGNLMVFVVSAIPVLLLLAVVGLPVYLAVRWFARKRRQPPPAPPSA